MGIPQTNLNDIIQNPDDRVAILKPTHYISLLIISPWKIQLPAVHLELGLLEYHPQDCYQSRQEGVLLQL